jgi:hypothetical protein
MSSDRLVDTSGVNEEPLLRIMAWYPPSPIRSYRLRQLLLGLVRVEYADPKPAIYAVNPAGYGMRLFSTETAEEADEKLERVGRELHEVGISAWCERYQVSLAFIESLKPPKSISGLRRFQPLL